MTPFLALLIFIALFIVYVYGLLVPLVWLVREGLLKLGDYVIGKRECDHEWSEVDETTSVCSHCGGMR